MTSLARRISAIGLLLLGLSGLVFTGCDGGSDSDECSTRSDCSDNQVCRDGSCVTADNPDATPTDGGNEDAMAGPDSDGMPDTTPDTGDMDELEVRTVDLGNGYTAKSFGVDFEDRLDEILDIEVTSDAVYVALHSEGDPIQGNTIYQHRSFVVKFNRSDGSVAWAEPLDPNECETKAYDVERANDGTVYSLGDFREVCSEGVSVAISAPIYTSFSDTGELQTKEPRETPANCLRAWDLGPDGSSLVGGGQTYCRGIGTTQPTFLRIQSSLNQQTRTEISSLSTGWVVDVTTMDSGLTLGAGYLAGESPEPFVASLTTDNSVDLTRTYGSTGIEPTGVAANNENIYVAGTDSSGNDQAVVLRASRSDSTFEQAFGAGNTPTQGKDITRGPDGNFWLLTRPVDSQQVRFHELQPDNFSSPTTTTVGFSNLNASMVTPQSIAVDSQGNAVISGTWRESGAISDQAFLLLPTASE